MLRLSIPPRERYTGNCDAKKRKEKKNVVSEVLRKYGVRVKQDDVSDTTMPWHNSIHLHAEFSCAYIRPETET